MAAWAELARTVNTAVARIKQRLNMAHLPFCVGVDRLGQWVPGSCQHSRRLREGSYLFTRTEELPRFSVKAILFSRPPDGQVSTRVLTPIKVANRSWMARIFLLNKVSPSFGVYCVRFWFGSSEREPIARPSAVAASAAKGGGSGHPPPFYSYAT